MSSTPQLSRDQLGALGVLSTLASSASITGSLAILICFAALPRLRTFAFTLVALLSATDIANQIFDLTRPSADDMYAMSLGGPITRLCIFQSVMDNFFEIASVLATTAIASALYATVCRGAKLAFTWRTILLIAAVCYGIPLILTIAAGAGGAFGPSGASCWIKPTHPWWQFFCFYAPLWVCVAYNSFVYVRVTMLVKRTITMAPASDVNVQRMRKIMRRLAFYPFVLVIVWTFSSINFLVEAFGDGRIIMPLAAMDTFFAGLQGLLNAIVYGMSPGILLALRERAAETFPSCCKLSSVSRQSLIDAGAEPAPPVLPASSQSHDPAPGVRITVPPAAVAGKSADVGSGDLVSQRNPVSPSASSGAASPTIPGMRDVNLSPPLPVVPPGFKAPHER